MNTTRHLFRGESKPPTKIETVDAFAARMSKCTSNQLILLTNYETHGAWIGRSLAGRGAGLPVTMALNRREPIPPANLPDRWHQLARATVMRNALAFFNSLHVNSVCCQEAYFSTVFEQ